MILGLTADQLTFFIIMIFAIILFITDYLRVDLVAALIILALALTGLIDVKTAFSGFSSEPAIIVATVFILSAGLSYTGVTDKIGDWVMKLSGNGETRAILVIMIAVALMSSLTHHLMITALMLPIVMKISKDEENLHASRLLIPMATAASLGTTLTLIGAPAFLLANNILVRAGQPELGIFSVSKIGVPLVIAGVAFCVLMRWILPKRSGIDDSINNYKLTDINTELIVAEGSVWIGKSLNDLSVATAKQFTTVTIEKKDKDPAHKSEAAILEEGDTLVVRTTPDQLVSFDRSTGLVLKALHKYEGPNKDISLSGEGKHILKAVISPKSHFAGKSIAEIDFYRRFGVVIVGLWRQTGWISTGVTETILQSGDTLVIWGPTDKLEDLNLQRGFLMLLPFYAKSMKRSKAKFALPIMVASIAAAAAGVPAYLAFMAGAVAMIITKCLSIEQAYESIETKIFVMIAGVIPLGMAMEKTGVDKLLAAQIINYTGGWNAFAMMMIFFWISALVTQIMSDAATTVLLAPVAIAFAKGAGISPTAAVICVTVGAVASFLTPIGHHGNLLILSPRGYKFADFLKIGLPLTVILSFITCYLTLLYW